MTSRDSHVLAPASLEVLPVPSFVAAVPSGGILQWNRAAAEHCGSETFAGATLSELLRDVHDDQLDSPTSSGLARAVSEGRAVAGIEATLPSPSGRLAVSVWTQPIDGAGGPANAILVLCHPIGGWAESARSVRRNEQRLAIALSAARLGSWEFDLRTRVLTSTAQCKANHGFRPDEDMQFEPDVVSAIYPNHRDRFLHAIEDAIRTHGSFEIEVPNRWRDGTEHNLLVAGRVVDSTCMVGVSQDISERWRTEQALRESEQQYRAIVTAANEGIWRLDEHARVVFVNDRMTEMLSLSPAEMIGRHKWDFVFEEDVEAMKGLFERRKQGVSEAVADIRFRRGDGREIWTLMSARPLYDAEEKFTGAVDLFTDITDRRRAEEAVRESDRRKDEFLAVLAHELRGPLAPILTAVKLLQAKGPPDPALQRLRDTIQRQAMQLSTLVEDLLDVGRITAGKLRLDKRRVDLRDIAHQALEVSSALIERRRHTLRVHLPDEPIYVDGDAARLMQVAGNLLSNAAKYTPEGGQIEVTIFERDGMGAFSVRDEGVGIPPEMLHRIFDRFVQVGTTGHRTESGLGIGLSVVKALVDLHGGSVEARSAGIGEGSEFIFRVPLAEAAVSA